MERRRSERTKLQHRITLESPETGSVLVTVRDISTGGLFVETGPVSLPVNARVVVSFNLPLGKKRHGFRLNAIVVRRTATGAGLMFLPTEPEVVQALGQALSGKEV